MYDIHIQYYISTFTADKVRNQITHQTYHYTNVTTIVYNIRNV